MIYDNHWLELPARNYVFSNPITWQEIRIHDQGSFQHRKGFFNFYRGFWFGVVFVFFFNTTKNYSWKILGKQLCDGLYQCGCVCNHDTGKLVVRPQVSRSWSFLLMEGDVLLIHFFTLERQNSGEYLFSRTMCNCTLVFFELRFKTN